MDILLISILLGALAGVPVWLVWQRGSARRGMAGMRRFDPRDAVPCRIDAVVLNARLLPDPDADAATAIAAAKTGARA